jgi:hypothetical protein
MFKLHFFTMVQFLCGLAYDCPFSRRIDNCPFKKINPNSFKEKFDWINGLSKEKQISILEHHLLCFRRREDNLDF